MLEPPDLVSFLLSFFSKFYYSSDIALFQTMPGAIIVRVYLKIISLQAADQSENFY
ncbi:hypothetical protein [Enterococcus avium]|uniref:hypothetical protein n=1 Tax=Enterococcus avium TaxID=33945 RepID=UPI00232E189A|nr:hypothetical protein [Enterococcus avium]MDB1733585.1 hypothetical protein [Enterococcus avium]